MARKRLLPLGLAFGIALGGVLFAAVWLEQGQPNTDTAQNVEQAQDDPKTLDVGLLGTDMRHLRDGVDGLTHKVSDLSHQIDGLRAQVSVLEQERAEMRRKVDELARLARFVPTDAESAQDTSASDTVAHPSPEEQFEAAEAQTEAQLQALEHKIHSERPDRKWAAAAERQIEESLRASNVSGVNLLGAKCRATLCRVELVRDAGVSSEERLHEITTLVPWPAPSITHIADTGEVVVYLAREGYELPQ